MMVAVFYLLPCLFILAASKPPDNSTCLTSVSEPTPTEIDLTTQLPNIHDDQGTTASPKRVDETYPLTQTNEHDRNEYEYKPLNRNISNPRSKRSQTGLQSIFRSLFVKPTNKSEETSNVRTSVTDNNADEADTKDEGTEKDVNMLYKLNQTLEKIERTLSILAKQTNLKIAVVDIPLQRLKRDVDVPNVSDIKLNVTSSNVTNNTDISGNVTKLSEDNERGTFVVTRTVDNATQFQDKPVDNTRSLRDDNVTESQETGDIAVTRSNNDNVTNTSNINVTHINTRRSFVNNQSDKIIKSALQLIQQYILNIKNHKNVSEESFKMGYIVSSLETLEQTLKKIMKRITLEGDDEWARKISVKIEMSKKIVSNLMEYLRSHNNNVKW